MSQQKVRILVTKPGLDGHDRGAKVVARALRDAGMEVIYTGIRQTPEMIVEVALQEDVDFIGLSCLSGAHIELFSEVMERLKQKEMGNIMVIAGGVIPEDDVPSLRQIGVKAVFGPGTPTSEIIDSIQGLVTEGKRGDSS